ncbi:uncharacterized protein [Choristoneura fumiferana]|uniref:uncharacterized protein n=1 Tax=Choristoneura fumiferana TaxID=7141 RepID=UPI003D153DCF
MYAEHRYATYKGAAPPGGRSPAPAMRPHVCLLLALAALHARAATIPAPAQSNIEKKIAVAVKDVLEKDAELQNVSLDPELIDETNVVKDIDNKLLKQVGGDAIPVKVVVDEVKPSLKASEDKKDCDKLDVDDDANIKRVEIDLKHPGEPQRQEHETQNPEHFENEHVALATFKKMINDAQNVFNKGFSDITHGIKDLLDDHEPAVSVQQNIDHLHETFMEHMDKLNATIQSYWNPEAVEDKEKQVSVKNVESGLKVLEENFEYGVKSLTTGVEVLSVLKSEIREDAASTTEKPSSNPVFQNLFQYFQQFQNTMQHGFGNMTTNVQNFFTSQGNNSSAAALGAQSDEGAKPSTSRPVWQGIQNAFQGLFNSGQQQQGAPNDESAPSGPFTQILQNNPFMQTVIGFIQPKPPQAQTQSTQPAPSKPAQSTDSEGSNVVPATEDKPADEQQQKDKPEAQPAKPQVGPIQQIIQKNPIVQGITGAVNRIQTSINNREKPREEPVAPAEKPAAPAEEPAAPVEKPAAPAEESAGGSEKAGFFPYGGYHHGHRPSDEHNNDVDISGVVKSAAVAEIEKVSEEKPLKIVEKEEKSPEAPVKQD